MCFLDGSETRMNRARYEMRRQEVNWNFIRLDCKSDLRHLFSAQLVSTHFSWRRIVQTFASLSPIFRPTFHRRQTEFTCVWQINGKDIDHETVLLSSLSLSYRWVRVPRADYNFTCWPELRSNFLLILWRKHNILELMRQYSYGKEAKDLLINVVPTDWKNFEIETIHKHKR